VLTVRDRTGEHPPSNQSLTSASEGFGELELIQGRGVLEELSRGSELLTKVGDATAEGEMPTQLKETNQVTAAPTAMTVERVREGVDIKGGMGFLIQRAETDELRTSSNGTTCPVVPLQVGRKLRPI